jgi:hypothetical protein
MNFSRSFTITRTLIAIRLLMPSLVDKKAEGIKIDAIHIAQSRKMKLQG